MGDVGKKTGFHMIQLLHLTYFHLFDPKISIDLFPFDKKSPVPADQDE